MTTSPDITRFAAVDIGGTKIHAAIGDVKGQLFAEARVDTRGEDGPISALERTANLIRSLEEQAGPVEAIGVGVPGLIDAEGIAHFLPNLPGHWKGVPVTGTLHRLTGHQAFALNDARMATLGEFVFGAGRESRRMLLITLGTGIGGGLVLDGRLQRGIFGGAGEVGHQTIDPNGPPCTCGSTGCLEVLASGPAIVAAAGRLIQLGKADELTAKQSERSLTPRDVAAAAQAGNKDCANLLIKAGEYLGIGMANAVTITAVDTIVLTGGLAALSDWLLPSARATMVHRVRMFPAGDVRLFRSELNDRAGILGAIALASRHPALETN